MGVHGLSGFLKRLGLDKDDASSSATYLSPGSTTLAIDGNGLIFHLFRMSYHRHRKTVLEKDVHDKALQAQLLLPAFTPLSLVHDVTTEYLTGLTTKHGLHLQIYFDGPDQYMKQQTRQSRKENRQDDWENVRQLCIRGILPDSNGPSKFRSSARRQAREHDRRSNSSFDANTDGNVSGGDVDNEAETYLSSFPLSPLVMDQIERSIYAFEQMSTVLPLLGSIQIIECDGEADAVVARASAKDTSGKTYALACDTDYLIYGYPNQNNDNNGGGETKYVQFSQIDPVYDEPCITGNVLTRSDVANAIGLPCPQAMVEFSILLGNDYTGPFVKHDDPKQRKKYWKSIMWWRYGDRERLPPEGEMSWYDIEGIVEHIAEKVADGWTLTSDNPELQLAIQFSYQLYSFGDISTFPSTAPGSTAEEESLGHEDNGGVLVVFPSLPPSLDMTLAEASNEGDLCEAALLPLATYFSDIGDEANDLDFIEQRHMDAFCMTLDRKKSQCDQDIEPPKHKLHWTDIQALYVLEKCLLAAMDEDEDVLESMPCRVFNHSIFLSFLESLSFEDFPLDNEVVSKNEKAFLEEATSEIQTAGDKPAGTLVLPIDEHKDEILHTIKTQRVTIIHGETGCGKSSRVPCFLLRADPPEPTSNAPEVKMIVSQPRRIAAKALAERVRSCEPDLTDKIGLRMGHGIREHETSKTRAWFVTTGYVVRLLANHPSWFDSHTHLIIDEVHERSVDTDILCLLCRRLLQSHPTIRLVLMSATLAAELYSQYFGSPQPPIHVGARRFPIKEYFVEDLKSLLSLSQKNAKLTNDVFNECEKNKCQNAPSAQHMEKLYKLATQITTSVGDTGSSVLIFVPGMADIEAISEMIEGLNVPNVTFICLPIHSDVPFEEQMAAFEPPQEGEVKVIIATNAAESSLTLPDVDHVICLGLCKQITYNTASHRQMLVPTWISRASATQRAGRTGRVREGNVYRLYSRDAFNKYMPPFEAGEIVRIPLDQVILSLRDMLGEAVTAILLDCLEPPDVFNIERSFQSLHASNFISNPTDDGEITSLGSLVVALGIDLTLGAFVGLGIQFGVAAEAIELAAILSFPKTPWAMSSPMYHDTETFNEIVSKTFTSRCFFDAGLFSEPMAIANLLHSYSESKDRNKFCWKHRVSSTRMRHLYGTVESLKRRVAECLNVRSDVLEVNEPPYRMHPSKVNILRILQIWLFNDTMIVHDPSKSKIECAGGGISIEIDGPPIKPNHLLQILDAERHPFEIKNSGKIVQQGRFDPEYLQDDRGGWVDGFDLRFASYIIEKNVDFSCYTFGTFFRIFVPADTWESKESSKLRDSIIGKFPVIIKEVSYLQKSGNARGRDERACGSWYPPIIESVLASDGTRPVKRLFLISPQLMLTKSQAKEFKKLVEVDVAQKIDSVNSILTCNISETKNKASFSMTLVGECNRVSDIDLRDLFAAPDLGANVSTSSSRQVVDFTAAERDNNHSESSNSHPMFEDAPEGARLMSVLASERRRDHFIRLNDGDNDDEYIDINIAKRFSINGNKWKRKNGGGMVFVPENCVPMAAIPVKKNQELFGCCANTLDLRGGACRVEGITLVPPGRLFVGIALLSFGLHPRSGLNIEAHDMNEYTDEEKKEAGEISYVVQDALNWIFEKEDKAAVQQEQWRIVEALDFHSSCMHLGEVLLCQPDKIKSLCSLLDGVCGHKMDVWDGYDISLDVAAAALRSKPIKKMAEPAYTNIKSNNEVKKESSKINYDKSVESAPSEPSTSKSKPGFACVVCHSILPNWGECTKHRDKCCPGTKFNRKKAIALASELEDNRLLASLLLQNTEATNIAVRDKEERKSETKAIQSKNAGNGNGPSFTLASGELKEKTDVHHACLVCKAILPNWRECLKHRKECCPCPGIKSYRKKAIALAIELESNISPSQNIDDQAKTNQGNSIEKQGVLKHKWACQGCNETFFKKKKCTMHMEKCCFGLVSNAKPKKVFECRQCKKVFEQLDKYASHIMEDCHKSSTRVSSTKANAAPKEAKKSKTEYACKSCKESFSTWVQCLDHMVECNLGILATLDNINPEDFIVGR